MNVIVLGNGFVAQHLKYKKVLTKFDSDYSKTESILDEHLPDVIINCIGYTGRPNIDQCEVEKEKTFETNLMLPLALAKYCDKRSVKFINVGSGCIYYGPSSNITYGEDIFLNSKQCITPEFDRGWSENDFANPKSYYSRIKYSCDLALGNFNNTCTLRIRMPISDMNSPRNYINKVRGYSSIIGSLNSMTFLWDFARAVDWVINNDKRGVYHVTNQVPLSAVIVMEEYKKYVPSHQFKVIDEEGLKQFTLAARSNCILDNSKLVSEGFIMEPGDKLLSEYMARYAKTL